MSWWNAAATWGTRRAWPADAGGGLPLVTMNAEFQVTLGSYFVGKDS